MGAAARRSIERRADETGDNSALACIRAINAYLFEDQRFVGNREKYEDPRNSCLNEVLDRRTGIPITLALVYMEVARRAGLLVDGVNFPGHFLVRCPELTSRGSGSLIIDPFHAGALLSEHDCRLLLQRHVGSEVAFDKSLLAPATRPQIIVRMLLNLKRIYVHMRSFPQARDRHRAAARHDAVSAQRAARSRPARVSPQRRDRRAARPADLPEAREHERDGQGNAGGARTNLGARQDAPAPRRGTELVFGDSHPHEPQRRGDTRNAPHTPTAQSASRRMPTHGHLHVAVASGFSAEGQGACARLELSLCRRSTRVMLHSVTVCVESCTASARMSATVSPSGSRRDRQHETEQSEADQRRQKAAKVDDDRVDAALRVGERGDDRRGDRERRKKAAPFRTELIGGAGEHDDQRGGRDHPQRKIPLRMRGASRNRRMRRQHAVADRATSRRAGPRSRQCSPGPLSGTGDREKTSSSRRAG